MKHNYSLFKKAASYAALSSAMLAAHKEADSQVVYTNLNPDALVNDNDVFYLDLNNDGTFDVQFKHSWDIDYYSWGQPSYILAWASIQMENSNSMDVGSGGNDLRVLSSGDMIDANNNWGTQADKLAYFIFSTGTFTSSGEWGGEENKFAAIKLSDGGNTYYGWIRMSVDYDGNIIVNDYAYNATPDAPILAGEGIDCNTFVVDIAGADSMISCIGTDVILYVESSNTLSSLQWFRNGIPIASTGTLLHVSSSASFYFIAGDGMCTDTSETVVATFDPGPIAIITFMNDTLSTGNFVTYQWYHGNVLLSGATNNYYVPLYPGLYSVEISNLNGCSATSNSFNVVFSGINQISSGNIKAYAADNTLIIEIPYSDFKNYHMTLFNSLGQQVLNAAITGMRTELPLQNLPAGIYEVVLQKGSARNIFKIVLQ